MNSTSDSSLPEGLEAAIQQHVKAEVESRVAEYKTLIRAFLLGLGVLVIFLIVNRLLSPESLLEILHNQIFGFEKHLTRVMSKNVNFSYANQFWLEAKDPTQFMAFYAGKQQKAMIQVEIKHAGIGEKSNVLFLLDDSRLWEGEDSFDNRLFEVTELIKKPPSNSLGENIHVLTFRATNRRNHVGDRVFVRVLINIFGLDE